MNVAVQPSYLACFQSMDRLHQSQHKSLPNTNANLHQVCVIAPIRSMKAQVYRIFSPTHTHRKEKEQRRFSLSLSLSESVFKVIRPRLPFSLSFSLDRTHPPELYCLTSFGKRRRGRRQLLQLASLVGPSPPDFFARLFVNKAWCVWPDLYFVKDVLQP